MVFIIFLSRTLLTNTIDIIPQYGLHYYFFKNIPNLNNLYNTLVFLHYYSYKIFLTNIVYIIHQ